MKKISLILIVLMTISFMYAEKVINETLPNGMQVVIKERLDSETVGLYCFVKTGSINEGKYLGAGISHYLEHVVSSGTTKFHTEADYQRMSQEMGAIVNAFTTQMVTAFHITVNNHYTDMALSNIAEQIQYCAFDSFEVAREKEVILKEIVMRSTPVDSKIQQRMSELLYSKSNRRYPVIGYPENFKKITREELRDYYHQRYAPNNMVFIAVGNFDADQMFDKISHAFQNFERRAIPPVFTPTQPAFTGTYRYIEEFETGVARGNLAYIVPEADRIDMQKLNLALSILFEKRNSPINKKIVEEMKLANWVYGFANESTFFPECDFRIMYEASDPKNVIKIANLIDEEIEKYYDEGFTQEQIDNYINMMKAQKILDTPDIDAEATRIGWNMIAVNKPDTYDIEMENLKKITPSDLSFVLKKYHSPKNRLEFFSVPKGMKSELESNNVNEYTKSELKKTSYKNITILHKYNNQKPIVHGVIYLPEVSSLYETKDNVGLINYMVSMMFNGSKKYSSEFITEWFEDHAVDFNVDVYDGANIEFKCLKSDLPMLKNIIFDAFNNPTFDLKEIERNRLIIAGQLKRSMSNPSTAHGDFRSKILYGETKNGLSRAYRDSLKMTFTQKDLMKAYKKYFKYDNKLIITLFGDIDIDEAKEFAVDVKKKLPKGKIDGEKTNWTLSEINDTFINHYNFEQVNVDINCKAPARNSKDYFVMKVIEKLLSGSNGRLFEATRGTNNLAYFAYASYNAHESDGFIRLTSQTSIDKKDELVEVLSNELNRLMTKDVSQEELDMVIAQNEKQIKAMIDDEILPRYATYFESIGFGFDYLSKESQKFKQVTPEDIKRVANQYFKNQAVIVSVPTEDVKLEVK